VVGTLWRSSAASGGSKEGVSGGGPPATAFGQEARGTGGGSRARVGEEMWTSGGEME
jgi:hypothetical protein